MIFCYVTDRHSFENQGDSASAMNKLLSCIARAVDAGVDWIQIRANDLLGRELLAFTRRAISSVTRSTRVIVNDRLDVALASGAAGVHLGSASVPAARAIRWLRAGNLAADFLVGVSCHSTEEAHAAEKSGANYIFFGPVYDTPSKKRFGPPQGTEKLAELCRAVRIPVLAIGGVNERNALDCLRAGAAGIAAIRMFQESGDSAQLAAAVSRLRSLRSETLARNP